MRKLTWLILLSALCGGCNKKTPPPQPENKDIYGKTPEEIHRVYTRGPAIRVDILRTYNPEASFTDQEAEALIAALNSLTDEELARLDIHLISSDYGPNQAVPIAFYANDAVRSKAIYFNQPKSSRPFDPEIGSKFLAYLGFPGRKVSIASQVFNNETQEHLFPEVMPGLVPAAPVPIKPPVSMFTPQHVEVISPQTPDTYVALASRAGHDAAGAEARRTSTGDYKTLTVDDQLRPHGVAKSHE